MTTSPHEQSYLGMILVTRLERKDFNKEEKERTIDQTKENVWPDEHELQTRNAQKIAS